MTFAASHRAELRDPRVLFKAFTRPKSKTLIITTIIFVILNIPDLQRNEINDFLSAADLGNVSNAFYFLPQSVRALGSEGLNLAAEGHT